MARWSSAPGSTSRPPVEQIWEGLREVERWPEWAPMVTSVRRLDDGPLAVRSRVRVEQPRIPSTEYVATELEPSRLGPAGLVGETRATPAVRRSTVRWPGLPGPDTRSP